jgi:hypothetical protein
MKSRFHGRGDADGNLLRAEPLEFRRGDWGGGYAMLCRREESKRYEAHRLEALRDPEHRHLEYVPSHVSLDEGYHYTLMGLFLHRANEPLMRRVYRLAGMMECVTNIPSSVLRSDLLRRFYQSIMEEREALGVSWRGNVPHFLLPLDNELYNPNLFFHRVSTAETLKGLFDAIEAETGAQFEVLCRSYVVYMPERRPYPVS